MEKLLEVKDLHVAFPSKRETVRAVDGVSFEVFQGETFGLVGESGCGKSQTLRSILGLLKQPGRVTGGQILYKGADIAKMNDRALQKIRGKEISMIFQEPMTSLNPVLRIRTQMYEAFEDEKLSREEKEKRALELLHLVGIPSPETRIDQYPFEFSGGMRQRIIIAIALANNPKLIIADEPTTALDVTIQAQVLDLIRDISKKLQSSVILITHDLGVVASLCDRINIMYGGKIVETGTDREIFYSPNHPYTKGLLSCICNPEDDSRELKPIPGSPPDLLQPPKGCPFVDRCDEAMKICKLQMPETTVLSSTHLSACWLNELAKRQGE